MRRLTTILTTATGLALLAAAASAQVFDDRTLLWSRGAPPNVLVLLDSGATMVHDAETNSLNFVASGDDPGSKLYQSKEVLHDFVLTVPNFNLGFSYYEKTNIEVAYLNFVYQVRDFDAAGNPQTAMLDGTPVGGVIRMGADDDLNHSHPAAPLLPIRFGIDGDETYLNQLSGNPDNPKNGDERVLSYLIDDDGARKVAGYAPFYYPAYFYGTDGVGDGLSFGRWVRWGLTGGKTWEETAAHNGIDTSDPAWKEVLRNYVIEDITKVGDPWGQPLGTLETSNQIGSTVLRIMEELQVYRNDNRIWVTTDTRVTEVEYDTHFVLYDHPITDSTQLSSGSDTLTAVQYQGNADCAGYLDEGQSEPIVPIPYDDDPSNRHVIASYLGPQTAPLFYFPHHSERFLPQPRDEWIPLTETVMAAGRRPIKDSINEAAYYFTHDIANREDELARCRKSFVILITDGVETCSNLNAPCTAARNLGRDGIAVFVIGYGPVDEVDDNVLSCVATESGGEFFTASSSAELASALRRIAFEIERRTRGFSSPVVPSVQASGDQVAFIASFLPSDERSVWSGSIHAYAIDPLTGSIPLTVDGTPDTERALWEAGHLLSETSASSRSLYFGSPSGSSMAIPGTRYPFAYAGDATAKDRIRNLINSSLSDDDLQTTIEFTRGVRDADLYEGSKLGDIFHSTPAIWGAPACFPCYLNDVHGYRSQFRSTHHRRRQVLYVGSNDGTLHAFDTGLWDADADKYDVGTGKELFAWLPRETMSTLDNLAFGIDHQWTVDGTATLADVWVDPEINAGSDPNPDDREWRSVMLFGQRRGGRSVVCLDITQPDTYSNEGLPQPASERMPSCAGGGSDCSGEWPAFRWEFKDISDEDGNYRADLGQTWSQPLVGFVHVETTDGGGTEVDERSVAIFGGGYDRSSPTGNFLYMVDIETGSILLKENIIGMVPSQVAALDLNLDGFLERIYVGTTNGKLWRMDIDANGTIGGDGRVTNWTPWVLFDAGTGQPFFLEPAIVPVSFDSYGNPIVAIVTGSGNRDNIFERNAVPNRFYVVLDRDDGVTLTEADLQAVPRDSAATTGNYLGDPNLSGWYLVLGTEEKVNTIPLVINQIIVFATFTPSEEIIIDDGKCRLRGDAKTYTVSLFNANPVNSESRYNQHGGNAVFATDPVMYVGADGEIHVLQSLDNLQLSEPVESWPIPLRVFSWKEE